MSAQDAQQLRNRLPTRRAIPRKLELRTLKEGPFEYLISEVFEKQRLSRCVAAAGHKDVCVKQIRLMLYTKLVVSTSSNNFGTGVGASAGFHGSRFVKT